VTTPVRGQNGRFLRTVDSVERDSEAARLRSEGHGYAEIAAQLGYHDASGAHRAVTRAFQLAGQEYGQAARELELDRIDRLLARCFRVADDPGPLVDRLGRPVEDPETGEPRPDQMVVLQAIDRATKLLQRRAAVTGTDAPRRSISLTYDQHLDAMRQLTIQRYGYDPNSRLAHRAWTDWFENDEPLQLGNVTMPRMSELSEADRAMVAEMRATAAEEATHRAIAGRVIP
jgi:hypothetical protein